MNIKPVPVDISHISKGRRFVSSLAGKALLPLFMTEACVEIGRTYQAYKRGGFTEARERITEEFLGALCWFGGVPLFDKLIDKTVGKHVLKLPEQSFEVGIDSARNSIANFVHENPKRFEKPLKGEKLLSGYRLTKLLVSVAAGTALVGLALPKFNQAITRFISNKKENDKSNENQRRMLIQPTMDTFLNGKSNDKKDVAFTGMNLMGIVNFVENTPKSYLIAQDVGVTTGRASAARNKYERNEILFRDIASAYFYMFNMPVMAAVLNKIEHGKSTRLDAVSAEMTENHLTKLLDTNGGKMSVEAFEEAVFGKQIASDKRVKKIDSLPDGRIELSKFKQILDDYKPVVDRFNKRKSGVVLDVNAIKDAAEKMADLQPALKGQKILTASQVKDLLTGGHINSPEFMHDLYKISSTKDLLFSPNAHTYQDKFGYISERSILDKKDEAVDFIKEIVAKAKKTGADITTDMVKKASKTNYKMNALNMISGFLVTALFASTLIPKMQYWLTKKATGSDKFPGTVEYENAQKQTPLKTEKTGNQKVAA